MLAGTVGVASKGIVSLVLLVPGAGLGLEAVQYRQSPADFVPVWMLTVGAVLALLGAAPAWKTDRRPAPRSLFRRLAPVVAALALTAWIAGSLTVQEGRGSDVPAAGSTIVLMEGFDFTPGSVRAEEGEIQVFMKNMDSARHTFTVDELGVDVNLGPSESRQITFHAGPGRYRFYCRPHDPGMEGDLLVGKSF